MLRKLSTLIVCLVATITTACVQTPPYNEIWYTTTDGRTISFNDDDLVSNSYNNGRGVLKFRDRVTTTGIGDYAFSGCSSLTSITIPNSVTSIEDEVFRYCSSLPVIDNIRYADTYLVETVDKSLTTYSIKAGTRFIGSRAFRGCSSLTSITIPDSVTYIGEMAFAGCSSLKSITIPESVTHIEKYAFSGCDSLTSITCLATTPPAIGNLRIGKTIMIYVPEEAVKAYKQDPRWYIYEKQIKPIK